jgi:ATP phosphoribosyltransferase
VTERRLTLAVPSKGRMAEPALRLCADAGLSFEATERALLVPCANAPVDLLLVRAHDVPEYVQDGVVDLGITGANLVVEAEARVETIAELGFARCTLQAAVPQEAPHASPADLDGLRVATAYPVSTRAALERLGVRAELVPVSGSVEAAPRLGLADAIVDLVSTGSTASANGLRLLGPLLESQAVLVANGAALNGRRELVERLELMISGVVAARRRRYLMLNAPREALDRIAALLPGMGAPSVIDLAEPGQVAVHAAVDADQVWELLAPLKAAGASSILVLPVERLVA